MHADSSAETQTTLMRTHACFVRTRRLTRAHAFTRIDYSPLASESLLLCVLLLSPPRCSQNRVAEQRGRRSALHDRTVQVGSDWVYIHAMRAPRCKGGVASSGLRVGLYPRYEGSGATRTCEGNDAVLPLLLLLVLLLLLLLLLTLPLLFAKTYLCASGCQLGMIKHMSMHWACG